MFRLQKIFSRRLKWSPIFIIYVRLFLALYCFNKIGILHACFYYHYWSNNDNNTLYSLILLLIHDWLKNHLYTRSIQSTYDEWDFPRKIFIYRNTVVGIEFKKGTDTACVRLLSNRDLVKEGLKCNNSNEKIIWVIALQVWKFQSVNSPAIVVLCWTNFPFFGFDCISVPSVWIQYGNEIMRTVVGSLGLLSFDFKTDWKPLRCTAKYYSYWRISLLKYIFTKGVWWKTNLSVDCSLGMSFRKRIFHKIENAESCKQAFDTLDVFLFFKDCYF